MPLTKICPECASSFSCPPSHAAARHYCSRHCAGVARSRLGTFQRKTRPSGEANPMYGRRRELAANWKGGRRVDSKGYIRIRVPDNYPRPVSTTKEGKWGYEHRVVIEKHLGRYLTSIEVVHHLDEDHANNDLDNLMLLENNAAHRRIHAKH